MMCSESVSYTSQPDVSHKLPHFPDLLEVSMGFGDHFHSGGLFPVIVFLLHFCLGFKNLDFRRN